MKSEMKMPGEQDREVKFQKKSRESRLSQVTGMKAICGVPGKPGPQENSEDWLVVGQKSTRF